MNPIVIIFPDNHVGNWEEVAICLKEAGYSDLLARFPSFVKDFWSTNQEIKMKADRVMLAILEKAQSYFKQEIRLGLNYPLDFGIWPLSIKPGESVWELDPEKTLLEPNGIEEIT